MGLTFSRGETAGSFVVSGDAGTRLVPELLDAIDAAIVEAAGSTAELHILYDLRSVDSGALVFADIEAIARLARGRWAGAEGTRMAICVGGKLMFGQARQYQIITEPVRRYAVGVFESMSAARTWLADDRLPDR